MGRVPDLRRRVADGQPPPPERPREGLAGAVLRHRQRDLGLRRQHAARVLRRRVPQVQHLHQELRPGEAHLPHRRRGQRLQLHVDRGADGPGRPADERRVAALLHAADRQLGQEGVGDAVRRGPVVLDAQPHAADGRAHHEARRHHGQDRPGEAHRPGRRRVGHVVRRRARHASRGSSTSRARCATRWWPRSTSTSSTATPTAW